MALPAPAVFPMGADAARVRFLPVISDNMQPTFRRGDFVAVAPINDYRGEGIYVFELLGRPNIYRAATDPMRPGFIVWSDNPAYARHHFTVEQFADAVIGQAFAICKVIDPTLIPTTANH